jgi:hypothetical protein
MTLDRAAIANTAALRVRWGGIAGETGVEGLTEWTKGRGALSERVWKDVPSGRL